MLMSHLGYVGVLAFILLGSAWLEIVLRTRVLRRWLRLLLALVPTLILFVIWDAYAIAQGQWDFDVDQIIGWRVIAGVPIDEVLFFVIVPLASILTLEAVRAARGWTAGDEPQ
jgi:lycopene cyclase domain-containing protein